MGRAISSGFVNVCDKEISEIKVNAVHKSMQNVTKYGFKPLNGKVDLLLIFYFEALQTAIMLLFAVSIFLGLTLHQHNNNIVCYAAYFTSVCT